MIKKYISETFLYYLEFNPTGAGAGAIGLGSVKGAIGAGAGAIAGAFRKTGFENQIQDLKNKIKNSKNDVQKSFYEEQLKIIRDRWKAEKLRTIKKGAKIGGGIGAGLGAGIGGIIGGRMKWKNGK
jgi:hypothetical protein